MQIGETQGTLMETSTHTLARVRVCTAASTRAKFPFPSVFPVSTYRPMHLTCFDEQLELWLECVLAADGGLRGGTSLPF